MRYSWRRSTRCTQHLTLRRLNVAIVFLTLVWIKLIWSRSTQAKADTSLESTVTNISPLAITARDNDFKSSPSFVIVCGSHGFNEMQPLIKSILLLWKSSSPIHLLFLTDVRHAGTIHEIFSITLQKTRHPIKVEIHVITEETIDSWANNLNVVVLHHPGRWGLAKMMIPWLFPDLDRAIVVDTDFIFLDNPAELLQLVPSNRTIYTMPLGERSSIFSMCSCIVLINCAEARSVRVYPNLIKEALETVASSRHQRWYSDKTGKWNPMLGDQGLYWILFERFPFLFESLPNRWNVQKCDQFQGALKLISAKNVSALHRNCSGRDARYVRDAASVFFDFFVQFKWHWLRPSSHPAYNVIVSVTNSSKSFSSELAQQ